MFLVALLVILLWCIVFALRSWMKPRHPSPPVYPGALPFIGHGLMMVIGGSQKMWKIEKKVYEYSLQKEEVVEFRLGPHSVYVISDPDDCLTVANTCLEKPYLYNFMKPMYNKGLVTLDSSTWKAHRKLLNPSFNQQVLQAFVPEYCTQAKYLVAQLASKVRKGPFDLQPYLIRNLLKTVCRTTLGLNTDEHSETVKTYAHVTEDFLNSILHRVQRVWLHLPYIFNKTSYKKKQDLLVKMLKDLTKQVIVNRKSELKEMKNLHKISEPASDTFKPLIDQLLQLADKKDVFTDEEIRDHLDTIVAAAYDTTASSLLFTFIFIGSHQDVQERMYKELQEVLGNEDRDLNRSDLSKLVYTEAVIKESLRLLPPVPRIMRCSTSGIKLKHYTLPASCTYLISLYASNRHPMWGADAELFRPERWLDPATLPANPNAFASFGLGRRNCIVNEQSTSTLDAEAAASRRNEEPTEETENRNGNEKMLRRMDTVPDIKRDTSGITTQYIATGIVNLGAFAAGVCVAWSSSALPLLTGGPLEPPSPTRDVIAEENTTPTILSSTHDTLTLTAAEASWVASLLCLGALWGSGPTGLISEYFGRKKTLLYLALPLVVSWILVASSPNVYGLYVGRFVGGVALGAFSVGIPPYIEDIAESHILPTLANFYHVHFSCGVLFGYIVGLVENTSWLTVLCASVPTAFFIAFIFLPESPAYLMSQGKFHEAKAALRYFRGIDNDIDSEIKALKERLRTSAKIKVTFKELFGTRSTVKALIVSFLLMVFQQMSGIFPVLFYAKTIFETFAISLNPPSAAIILGFCFVSSTYFSTTLLKIVRRRILLMVSFAAMAVNLACLGIYYHLKASNLSPSSTWVPLFTLCLFVSFYASGVGPIPWLMLREIFPPHMTRRATALTAGFHWFLAFGVTKLYQNLVDMVKPGWTLWAFSISCLVGIVFVYFFVPETKGRSLEEIQNEFEGIHKKRKHRHVIEVESVSEA